jgi:hypothetical protein
MHRGFAAAFGLSFCIIMMNVGALLSGFVVDAFSLGMEHGTVLGLSVHRWVFATGVVCSIVMLVLALSIHPELRCDTDVGASESCLQPGVWMRSVREIGSLRSFWRFLALTLITVNLRSIFRSSTNT